MANLNPDDRCTSKSMTVHSILYFSVLRWWLSYNLIWSWELNQIDRYFSQPQIRFKFSTYSINSKFSSIEVCYFVTVVVESTKDLFMSVFCFDLVAAGNLDQQQPILKIINNELSFLILIKIRFKCLVSPFKEDWHRPPPFWFQA